MTLLAKPIVKNKYWIVEDDGKKIATILTHPNGVTYIRNQKRESYPSLKVLSDKHNIIVDKSKPSKISAESGTIYGYPCGTNKVYNILWDVPLHLPIFTKENKSKSFYCAGYYVVQLNDVWEKVFCPKLITLQRYPYYGPFTSNEEAETKYSSLTA